MGVAKAFVSISESSEDYPVWFSEGKTRLIPKSEEFTSENQSPITYLNNMLCLQDPIDSHLTENELMENEQRCKGEMQWNVVQPYDRSNGYDGLP